MTFASTALALAPAAYYKLDETSGTVAADSSGNSRGALAHSSVTVGATSLLADGSGKAATYNGSSAYSTMGYATWMAVSGGMTVLARVKPTSGVLSVGGFIASRWASGGDVVWLFGVNSSGKAAHSIYTGAQYTATSAASLTAGTIYTIAMRWDSTTNKVSSWINGVKDGETATAGAASGSSGNLELGRAALANGSGLSWGGDIDEFLYWPTTALSDADMLALHNAAVAASVVNNTANPADPVGITESITLAGDRRLISPDAVGLNDAVSLSGAVLSSIDDAVAVADAATPVVTTVTDLLRTAADPIGVTDSLAATFAPAADAAPADVVHVTDAVTVDLFAVLPGSAWDPYPVTSSGSKVLDFSIVPTNPVAPWPFPYEGEGYSHSLWLVFTATDTQILTLTLTAPFPAGIEVWSGDTADLPDNLSILGYGQGTLDVAIAPGQRILMRAHPLALDETRSGTLAWSVAARVDTGVLGLVCDAQVLETPGWLGVSLLSATPSSDVTFALDGGAVFFTVTTEDDGTFAGDVELPSLTVGPHTVTAVDVATGQTETEGFAVTLAVPADDIIPGSTPPVTEPSSEPVIHWVLEDPMPGGLGAYTFPVNPSEMSSPWPEKQLRPERTIHGSGSDIVWEGRADPVDWTVKGSVLTQAFYDKLTAYHAVNRRLYAVDHHQRAWVVAFDGLTFEKKGRPDNLWFYTYTAKFVILGGPVTLG